MIGEIEMRKLGNAVSTLLHILLGYCLGVLAIVGTPQLEDYICKTADEHFPRFCIVEVPSLLDKIKGLLDTVLQIFK